MFYFLVNQSGSLLYTISLSYNPISVAVPIANSVNLGVIVLLGCLYEENVRLDLRKQEKMLESLNFIMFDFTIN